MRLMLNLSSILLTVSIIIILLSHHTVIKNHTLKNRGIIIIIMKPTSRQNVNMTS